jgi:hypothetical protein
MAIKTVVNMAVQKLQLKNGNRNSIVKNGFKVKNGN